MFSSSRAWFELHLSLVQSFNHDQFHGVFVPRHCNIHVPRHALGPLQYASFLKCSVLLIFMIFKMQCWVQDITLGTPQSYQSWSPEMSRTLWSEASCDWVVKLNASRLSHLIMFPHGSTCFCWFCHAQCTCCPKWAIHQCTLGKKNVPKPVHV